MTLLVSLFDSHVATAEYRGHADPTLLAPEEAAYASGFAERRLAEFTAGRLCARRALAQLGVDPVPIAVAADRSPVWPIDIAGSISHTGDYACAAVARRSHVESIGIDAEQLGRVTPDIEPLVYTAGEIAFLDALAPIDRRCAATIIFSAKEAVYKCQSPLTHTWLDFTDVEIRLSAGSPRTAAFDVMPVSQHARAVFRTLPALEGRCTIDDSLVATGVVAWTR